MGQVAVSFMGVCTTFQNLPSQVPPGTDVPANRVVLVRSTIPDIPVHTAKLQIPGGFHLISGPPLPPIEPPQKDTYALDGVGLIITNPAGPAASLNLGCLPGLQAHLSVNLGPPAQFVFVPDRQKAQAWFDVQGGVQSWQGFLLNPKPPCPTEPSVSVLEMETDGPPTLQYTRWDGSGVTTVQLEGEHPHIAVMNFADGSALVKDNKDFFLNYLTAATVPSFSDITIPQTNACTQRSPFHFHLPGCGDAGPGCSTTNFP